MSGPEAERVTAGQKKTKSFFCPDTCVLHAWENLSWLFYPEAFALRHFSRDVFPETELMPDSGSIRCDMCTDRIDEQFRLLHKEKMS